MNHTVDTLTKFEGGLNLLHMAGIYSDSTTCKIINNYRQAAAVLTITKVISNEQTEDLNELGAWH